MKGTVVAMVVSVALACDGDGPNDGRPEDSTDHTYVIDGVALPTNPGEAMMLGLDIDERAGDGVDNQLGMLLPAIGTLAPDLQAGVDAQVDEGGVILLANLRAPDLDNASGAGLWFYEGVDAVPAPCVDEADEVCRRHLAGTGTFAVAPAAATDSMLAGRLVAATFQGGPGVFTLPLRLSNGPVFYLPLQRAKVLLRLSANAFEAGSKLGGALRGEDVDRALVPGLHGALVAWLDADCAGPRTPPSCGCEAGTRGAEALALVDANDDCVATLAETREVIDDLVTLDLDLDGDGVDDALSIGVGLSAVKGSFAVPPRR
jgi:hypothetical protein